MRTFDQQGRLMVVADIGPITFTGDVTGSGSGSVALTIAANVVTYAKMQDVTATQRLLGRFSGGSGDPEEGTISSALDWIGSTRGSILYRGASGWAILAPGTASYVLTSNGAGADPSYQEIPPGLTRGQVLALPAAMN